MSAATRIRFCVADDHIVIHDGLRAMADRTDDLEYAGGAADVASLRLLLDKVHPDLLVLDLRFGCVDGFAVCRDVLREHDTLKVMFFSAFGDVELLREGVASGGSGYLLKDASTASLPAAMRQVMTEGNYFDPRLAGEAIRRAFAPAEGTPRPITDRERVILTMIADGKITKEIARELSLSPHTIKSYVSRLMKDFGVARRAELVRVALDRHLIRRSEER